MKRFRISRYGLFRFIFDALEDEESKLNKIILFIYFKYIHIVYKQIRYRRVTNHLKVDNICFKCDVLQPRYELCKLCKDKWYWYDRRMYWSKLAKDSHYLYYYKHRFKTIKKNGN